MGETLPGNPWTGGFALEYLTKFITEALEESAGLKKKLAGGSLKPVEDAVLAIYRSLAGGNKLILMGNGGSASDAEHIAAELAGRFGRDRRALPAIAITTNGAVFSAISNDYGYKFSFSRQIEALAQPGDVVAGFSTSGRSENIIAALGEARSRGCTTVGFTGSHAEYIRSLCDIVISVPSTNTARIQEVHITIGHVICELVEKMILGDVVPNEG